MKSVCGASLQIVGKIVGCLNLVFALSLSALVSYTLIYTHLHYNPAFYTYYENVRGFAALGISLLSLIGSVFLLLGIKKQNHLMMLPWLVNVGFEVFGAIVQIILILTIHNPDKYFYIYMAIGLPIYAFIIYIYIGMLSLYNQFRLGRDEQQKKKLYGFVNL